MRGAARTAARTGCDDDDCVDATNNRCLNCTLPAGGDGDGDAGRFAMCVPYGNGSPPRDRIDDVAKCARGVELRAASWFVVHNNVTTSIVYHMD